MRRDAEGVLGPLCGSVRLLLEDRPGWPGGDADTVQSWGCHMAAAGQVQAASCFCRSVFTGPSLPVCPHTVSGCLDAGTAGFSCGGRHSRAHTVGPTQSRMSGLHSVG